MGGGRESDGDMVNHPATLPPKTTAEEDRKTTGQRRINMIWEMTQAAIALSVVLTAMSVSAAVSLLVLRPDVSESSLSVATTAFLFMSNVASLVIGFYFGRTNHQRVGGVGAGGEQTR
jgi:hypothetical protein